jgi:hypothetical protein
MNFTTLDHIREIINDGAIYWTLRDRNNSAILAEQTAAISAGDSYDKLTRNIKEMRGDFVKLSLSARNPAEKNAGGNVKSYGPFNIEITNAGNTAAVINGPPQFNLAGPSWQEHIILMRDNERLAYRCTDLERQIKEAENGMLERIAGQFAPVINQFVTGSPKKAPEISGAGVPVTFEDQETAQHVYNLSQRPKFNEVVKNLDQGGLLYWSMVLENLKIKNDAAN